MAWQFTKRHQEALWYEQSEPGGSMGSVAAGAESIRRCRQPLPLRQARQWRHWLTLTAASLAVVMGQGAQAETAPFVFDGSGALRIDTPGWESDRGYVVSAPAYIDVSPGVKAHISGGISPVPGSRNGLYKLGAGTLRLSGPATYQGGTQLLQGGLHVDGPQVFGVWGFIEARTGTTLEYSPGTLVRRALTLRGGDVSLAVPTDLYTPVVPPPGLDDAMGWRVERGTATHAGLLQGDLPFVKLGAGVLDISGDAMGYSGEARVMEGALAINEIFFGSAMVGAGARLQGTGSVLSARIQSGGTLAPGNTMVASGLPDSNIGMMAVSGDLHFDPGSLFEVEAAPTGESDYVWVGGKALLDGKVNVLAQDGIWNADTSFAILSAQGGFDDTEFASVESDLAFLSPSLEYSADTVTLTLKRNETSVEDVGETPDEEDVGRVIDEDADDDSAGNGGAGDDVVEGPKEPDIHDEIVVLDRDSARQALKQLTGSWNASVLSSIWGDSRFLREAVLHQSMNMIDAHMLDGHMFNMPVASSASNAGPAAQRVMWHVGAPPVHRVGTGSAAEPMDDADGAASSATPAVSSSWMPWVELFHSDQERDGHASVPDDTRRLNGMVLGVARALNAYWKMGAFLGAQNSRLGRAQGIASAEIATTHAGLHLAGHVAGWRLVLGAARSLHRIKSSRFLQAGPWRDAVAARYNGDTTQVFGEAAWPLNFSMDTRRFAAAPFVRLAWVRTGVDGFTESGGPAALTVQPGSMAGWVSTLGLRAEAAVSAGDVSTEGRSSAGVGEGKIFAQLAWNHVGSNEAKSTQAFRDSAAQTLFTSQGLGPVRQSWSVRLGLDARVGKASNVGFAYMGSYGRGLRDQGIGGWARIMF